jgi:hypothetical protein
MSERVRTESKAGSTASNDDPAGVCRRARTVLRAPGDLSQTATASDVERVVVILASSRGMSSFLFRLLRSTGAFASLVGEHIHLYKIFGLLSPHEHDGVVNAADADPAGFASALLDDLIVPSSEPVPEQALLHRFARALYGQWHETLPPVEAMVRELERALPDLRAERHDPDLHFLRVIGHLRRNGVPIEPWYYDIAPEKLASVFPDRPQPAGPPELSDVIEEPPFVVPGQGRAATRDDLRSRPLLLKSSSDAYRVDQIARLFPAARITYVHLTRNPAASINGLVDGWLHRGFFSRHLQEGCELAIPGYSEQPWGTRWWKFDLPPGWQRVRTVPLAEVAAFQWWSAHASILASLPALDPASVVTVRGETLVEDTSRQASLARILQHAGVEPEMARQAQPSVVMSTAAPKPGRWRARQDELAQATSSDEVCRVASALGYGDRPGSGWI